MKRSRFSEEQIVYAIRQGRKRHADWRSVSTTRCKRSHLLHLDADVHPLGVSELRRLRKVEEENARLKRLVADLSLDKHMLSEAL